NEENKHSRHTDSLLSLLFILALSDGADCQNFKEFKRRHILSTTFKTKNEADWVKYLLGNELCGRTKMQSFIKSSEAKIEQICNGSGSVSGSYTKSTDVFEVYLVKSSEGIHPKCIINNCSSGKYNVIVKCENNLPVHYERQDIEQNTRPQPCFQRALF
uniref:Ribonuclease A-domain domain-containing protein n=1 Tax=Sinocyclocheilus grahami TaxID=75366 RepID=A0A672KDS4_SINGR